MRSFGKQIAKFLYIARGHKFKVSYAIPHTNPRLFNIIKSNNVFIEVLGSCPKKENCDVLGLGRGQQKER